MDEDGGPERADGEPDRERHGAVRPAERAGEPGEADADHEPADRVVRGPGAGDETRGDEAPAGDEAEDPGEDGPVLVVRGRDERELDGAGGERGRPVEEPEPARRRHGRRPASASAESSAFGTKPPAPEYLTSGPKSEPSRL